MDGFEHRAGFCGDSPVKGKGILLLTASEQLAEQVAGLLRREGLENLRVLDPTALAGENVEEPELVLIDLPMARHDARNACRHLRNRFEPEFVPLLALITGGDSTALPEILAAGFDDAVAMPHGRTELAQRVCALNRLKQRYDDLALANSRLMELSSRDELTGLYNRRHFFECLALEHERAIRYQQPLACIMIDLDEFKPINDNYGHLVGDALFKKAAALFKSIPRRVDVVARYGGDEVVILLPATKPASAEAMAQRLCDTMADNVFEVTGRNFAMTVSVGVATLDPENPVSEDELLARADLALYAAKRAGRNQVRAWSSDLVQTPPPDNHPFTPAEENS